jgi:hypothetical protein
MGTGGPFPRGKAGPGRNADHSPPSSAVGAIPLLPPSASMACSGTALALDVYAWQVTWSKQPAHLTCLSTRLMQKQLKAADEYLVHFKR